MKSFLLMILLFPLLVNAQIISKRADSFFGVAFDFNADANTKNIGQSVSASVVDNFLMDVRPDFIQVDSKGDQGYSSYPTKVGTAAPDIVQDPLKIFRAETSKFGIGLYAHYCALYDGAAVKKNPTWGRLKANGLQDSLAVSLFSPYVDTYFMPQLQELINYKLDGLWIDSDCWVVEPDYSADAKAAYLTSTGKQVPKSYGDPDMLNYIAFTRLVFHHYLNHYVSTLHALNPGIQICSSWAYAYMTGPVDVKVDFLSGDLNTDLPVDVEYQSRLLSAPGLPWDLMEWVKPTALPMEKKAAIILAQGGAYEIYIVQNRDASLPMSYNPQVKETAAFCRSYKDYCFKTTPIPQVAVLLSAYGYNKEASSVFSISEGNLGNVKSMANMYLNMKYSVQILQEQQFNSNLSVYPLIVIPGWQDIDPDFVTKLKNYVAGGGNLLIQGIGANFLFSDVERDFTILGDTGGVPVKIYSYGLGKIIGVPVDTYGTIPTPDQAALENQIILNATNILFPTPLITVTGNGNYHINATTKNNEKIFHVVNVDSQNVTTDPLNVSLQLAAKPSAIMLQPDNKSLPFTYDNGVCNLTMPGVAVYSILEVRN